MVNRRQEAAAPRVSVFAERRLALTGQEMQPMGQRWSDIARLAGRIIAIERRGKAIERSIAVDGSALSTVDFRWEQE